MNLIGVVHLARAKNGIKPFEDFLRSYRLHPAGISHDFIIIYKGFDTPSDAAEWERLATDIPHRTIQVSDEGFDLRAYRIAAEQLPNEFVYFLNSFSKILADDWLKKTFALMNHPGIGIVGATGSWESMLTNALSHFNQIPRSSILERLKGFIRLKGCELFFDPFPNPHIRTNAFLMRREILLRVWPKHFRTKRGAYLFENGRNSLTHRLKRMGLETLVVGKDGSGYQPTEWNRSNTFRSINVENLFVEDNQTRLFQNADAQIRLDLAEAAWGQTSPSQINQCSNFH
jgi:hypothetical protein